MEPRSFIEHAREVLSRWEAVDPGSTSDELVDAANLLPGAIEVIERRTEERDEARRFADLYQAQRDCLFALVANDRGEKCAQAIIDGVAANKTQ